MTVRISVAMPVFNRAEWIGKTLEHIFNQSVAVDEVILCDDGSTDNLDAALAPFKDRIKVLRIENSGPAVARKTAVENSSGEWVALCDSDDFWEVDHIENFTQALRAVPDLELFFSNFRPSDNASQTKFDQAPVGWLARMCKDTGVVDGQYGICSSPFLDSLLEFQACFPSCIIFRRSLYDMVGGISDYVSRWPSEDFHLTARMAASGKGVIGIRPDVLINKHPGNFSSEYVRNLQGEVDILEDILNQKLVPEASTQAIRLRIHDYYLRLSRAYYWSGQYGDAIKTYRNLPKNRLDARDFVRLLISAFLLNIRQ